MKESDSMNPFSSARKLTRRTMLKATAAVGGGLILSVSVPRLDAVLAAEPPADFSPNAFVSMDTDGKVTFTIPQVEMGQGIYTALSMILAEELDAPFERVTAIAAPPNDKLYGNPLLGFQVTGGSTSVRAFWKPMRLAGATARAMLVQAAAAKWSVDPSSCRTENGVVLHDPSAQKASYGELVQAAAALTLPQNPPLKPASDFKLIGKSLKRLDTPDKVNGKAIYGIDARPEGVKVATLASCPVFGGKVAHVNNERAKTVPGVRQVIVLDDLVAVVGDHMWAAKKGLNALDITWDEGPNAAMSTADVLNGLVVASENKGAVAKTTGDVTKALGDGTKLDATYHVPFLAHAPMEPMNCTVHVRPDACEIWVGNQVITRAQGVAAKLTGLPLEKVIVHNHLVGGGFGRRLEVDYIAKAVRIAQKVDGPVKVIWTREEDIQQALYRPFYFDRFQAAVSGGKITAWSHRIAGSSILARWRRLPLRMGSIRMRSTARLIFPTTRRTFTSNMSMPSRPACRPASGEAWARDTISLSSRVSSTNWLMPRGRIPSPSGERISKKSRASSLVSILRRKSRVGEARCPLALGAGWPARACSARMSRRSWRRRSTTTARSRSAV
jgi:isoquinoline 1-oxidoreductase beta subunit